MLQSSCLGSRRGGQILTRHTSHRRSCTTIDQSQVTSQVALYLLHLSIPRTSRRPSLARFCLGDELNERIHDLAKHPLRCITPSFAGRGIRRVRRQSFRGQATLSSSFTCPSASVAPKIRITKGNEPLKRLHHPARSSACCLYRRHRRLSATAVQ